MTDTNARSERKGKWCCPACKNRYTTLAGINRQLYRKHGGEGFGIYRTAAELATRSPYDLNGLKEMPGE